MNDQENIKVVVGADHGGFELKEQIETFLKDKGFHVYDIGTHNTDSVDYPDISEKVCEKVLDNSGFLGIVVCGTGIGVSIKANRYAGIRAALVHSAFTAEMAKAHNNANVLCLGARTTEKFEDALTWVQIWLDTAFEGGRHLKRIQK